MKTSRATIKWGIIHAHKSGRLETVKPEFWARTHSYETSEIEEIIAEVRREAVEAELLRAREEDVPE